VSGEFVAIREKGKDTVTCTWKKWENGFVLPIANLHSFFCF